MALPGAADAVAIPLNLIDNLLLELSVGQVLIAVFVLAMLAALPLRSTKVLSINVVAFGVIFMLTPYWVVEGYNLFLYAGIAMIFIGTMGFVYARR
ncbi:MAG: hypothetical protein ACOC0X_04400 [Halobacteriota archaeon]